MGAKMHGSRTRAAGNDNFPKRDRAPNEKPIPADERRGAPIIEAEAGKGWFCLVTVPQREYRCADGLSERGIPNYVPTQTYWERRRKGKELFLTELQRPLFRGYVFAQLPNMQWREDPAGGQYATLPDAWGPVFERDAWGQSRLSILHFLGSRGCPAPMPISVDMGDGRKAGLAPLAEEEREGWFDDRKRPHLVAFRNKQAEEAIRLASMRPVMKGEHIEIREGPFAGYVGVAMNDNSESGWFRLVTKCLGGEVLVKVHLEQVENLARPMRHAEVALRRA